jgi:predicted HTH domain antitoxin
MILDYHRKGYSITKIAELVDTPIERVMEVLSKLNEELHDINEELEDIEKGRLTP